MHIVKVSTKAFQTTKIRVLNVRAGRLLTNAHIQSLIYNLGILASSSAFDDGRSDPQLGGCHKAGRPPQPWC